MFLCDTKEFHFKRVQKTGKPSTEETEYTHCGNSEQICYNIGEGMEGGGKGEGGRG